MWKYLFLFVLFCGFDLLGQSNAPKEVVDGKKYYIHTVEQGNTLYGLQRTYGVPVETIVSSNPGLEKGLVTGSQVKIPLPLVTVTHVVQKKETLFGIAKTYGVSVNEVSSANPAADQGLKVGQKLIIHNVDKDLATSEVNVPEVDTITPVQAVDTVKPTVTVSFSDSIVEHTVLSHETLYSISKRFMVPVEELQRVNELKNSKINPGDKLKIPVKKERIEPVEVREVPPVETPLKDTTFIFEKKERYKVAIMLPFNLDKASGDPYTNVSTEFYMGAQLALDSLEKLGLKAEVFIHDTRTDSTSLKKVMVRPEFKGIDLVIGPLMGDNAEIVARWCKQNGVRMVCPVAANTAVLKNNPFVYQAVPSDFTMMEGLAGYVLKNHAKEQILLLKTGLEKDKLNYEAFRNSFMSLPTNGARPKLIEVSMDNYATFIKKGVNTVFVCPTVDRSTAVKFHNGLNTATENEKNNIEIFVYGTKDWLNFDELAIYKTFYHFAYCSPNDFSYSDPRVIALHKKYRSEYKSDMTKIAVQGFDVTFYFASRMLLDNDLKSGVMNSFNMKQAGSGNGYENKTTFILKQVEGEFINVE